MPFSPKTFLVFSLISPLPPLPSGYAFQPENFFGFFPDFTPPSPHLSGSAADVGIFDGEPLTPH